MDAQYTVYLFSTQVLFVCFDAACRDVPFFSFQCRFTLKYRHSEGILEVKVTDDHIVSIILLVFKGCKMKDILIQ